MRLDTETGQAQLLGTCVDWRGLLGCSADLSIPSPSKVAEASGGPWHPGSSDLSSWADQVRISQLQLDTIRAWTSSTPKIDRLHPHSREHSTPVMTPLSECVASARLLGQSNYNKGDERWWMKQLHFPLASTIFVQFFCGKIAIECVWPKFLATLPARPY